ncbi:hypothetical protein N7457_005605 [Penicillium paradoxum]|uniref:uncharacterized protein n=1 Tax=Penicillium paradoxum TaxID=176176 RepID=UPI002549AB52|nr:uncharacterized protein N7457_005605 [Penicillium paradoxum]KAJ5780445.1 hypothetical protein N7457_005605 [Penicillium paradoxum]
MGIALFAPDLSAMISNRRSYFCSPLVLTSHHFSPHLYLHHAAVWFVMRKARTEPVSDYPGALVH